MGARVGAISKGRNKFSNIRYRMDNMRFGLIGKVWDSELLGILGRIGLRDERRVITSTVSSW